MQHAAACEDGQLPTLDVELFRAALRRQDTEWVHTPRAGRPESEDITSRLRAAETPLALTYDGDYKRLRFPLGRVLSILGDLHARSLADEILHLVRFFMGVTEDPKPRVELAYANALPHSLDAELTLISPLLGTDGERWRGLAPRSVYLGRGDMKQLAAELDTEGERRQLVLLVSTAKRPFFLKSDGPTAQTAPAPGARDVVLISMPFGPLHRPSLGLSLLQATIDGPSSEILYFTLPFSERVGAAFYAWICDSNPSEEALAGEWIFSGAASGSEHAAAYVNEILRGMPDYLVDELLLARGKVDAFLKECVAEVVARRPKILGFTSLFQQHQASLALAKRLRSALPEVPILFGGANCEGLMGLETLRRFDFIDAVVSGEADQVFSEIVDRLLAGRSLAGMQGVMTRESALSVDGEPPNTPLVVKMDELPRPDFDDFFRQWRAQRSLDLYEPGLLMETSRGCWWGAKHHCTFCGLNGSGMSFRSKSASRALAELTELTERYPELSVSMVDNILDMKYFKSLVAELAERNQSVELFFETKANLKKEQIGLLRQAGVASIQPGIESFSDEVLRIMRKGVTGLQNIQLLKWCHELGVWPYWNLLWGFPGEPSAAYGEIAEMMPLLHHLPPPEACGPLRLDRFSPNFNQAEELGFRDVTPWRAYRHIYPFPEEAVANLAYYFGFRYQDGRQPADYARPVAKRVAEWKEAFDSSHLTYTDKGSDLLIWDMRRTASRKLTLLSGVERVLYLECDRIRSLGDLSAIASRFAGATLSEQEIEEILQPWIRDGLAIRQDSRVLALAVPSTAASAESANVAA